MPSPTAFRPQVAALLQQVTCLTTDEVSLLLAGAPSAHEMARMRASKAVFGFRFAHVGYLYPSFQFEHDKARVDPVVVRINRLILSTRTAREALDWWQDGADSPVNLLEAGRHEDALALALGSLPIVH